MTKPKQRQRSNRRRRSLATTLRAIILEGTGIIALILVISMVRSGNATSIEPLSQQTAITDLKNWLGQFRKPAESPRTAPQSDFGQGFSYARGDTVEQESHNFQRNQDWVESRFPVRTADYNSVSK